MSNKIYFINQQYLKDNSVLNLNIEPQLINQAIIESQYIHIQQMIGTDLYKKFEYLISGNTISNHTDYKLLLDDYIIPCLVNYSIYESIPYIRFKMMNKSVGGQSSDNSTPADLEEIKFLQANIKNKAEFLGERLISYLINHTSLYPEYSTNECDDIKPEITNYFCGIQLDDDLNCDRFLGYNDKTRSLI